MKNRLAVMGLSLLFILSASRGLAAHLGNTVDSDIFSEGKDSLHLYVGYDYAILGDIINGTQQNAALYKSLGANATASTDNSGVLVGLAWGKRLDPDSEVSLSFEVISSQADVFTQSNSSNLSYQSIGPNVMDLSLNWDLDLLKGPGNRTSLTLGAGYYRAVVDYTNDLSEGSPVTYLNQINGQFTGDTAGGTLGLKEQVQIGSQFGLNLFVRGRYVDFARVQAAKLSGYSNQIPANGPYSLVRGNSGGYDVLIPGDNLSVEQSQGTIRYANLDYSGFDGGLSLEMDF